MITRDMIERSIRDNAALLQPTEAELAHNPFADPLEPNSFDPPLLKTWIEAVRDDEETAGKIIEKITALDMDYPVAELHEVQWIVRDAALAFIGERIKLHVLQLGLARPDDGFDTWRGDPKNPNKKQTGRFPNEPVYAVYSTIRRWMGRRFSPWGGRAGKRNADAAFFVEIALAAGATPASYYGVPVEKQCRGALTMRKRKRRTAAGKAAEKERDAKRGARRNAKKRNTAPTG